jgi:uncharacterized protein YjiS (DUF1127 family)
MSSRHSSQNMKRVVEPHTEPNGLTAPAAFADRHLPQDAWRAALKLHCFMPRIANLEAPMPGACAANSGPASVEHDHGSCTPPHTSNVVQSSRAVAPDSHRHSWYWLASLKDAILSFHARRRRERDVRRTVAALSQFNDQTLRDMGIPSRSQIELVVRFCYDC